MNLPEDLNADLHDENLLMPALTEVELDKEYDFTHSDIHATIIGIVPTLVEKARRATKSELLSHSYRGFRVGAAALAYSTDSKKPEVGIYTAGNFKAKLHEEEMTEADIQDIPKNCAEMDIVMRASSTDLERIGIFVIAATTKQDKIKAVTELGGATLEPCDECESAMRHSDLVDDQTIILTVGSGENIFQVQNFKSLHQRYAQLDRGKPPSALTRYPYSPIAWERRQRRYIRACKRAGLERSVYDRNRRQERQARELVLDAMKSTED